jgi:hypothetical protein
MSKGSYYCEYRISFNDCIGAKYFFCEDSAKNFMARKLKMVLLIIFAA